MFDVSLAMEFLGIDPEGRWASLCSIGGDRKVVVWRQVSDPAVAAALRRIPKNEKINVSISGNALVGLQTSDGEIVGTMFEK